MSFQDDEMASLPLTEREKLWSGPYHLKATDHSSIESWEVGLGRHNEKVLCTMVSWLQSAAKMNEREPEKNFCRSPPPTHAFGKTYIVVYVTVRSSEMLSGVSC